MYSFCIVLALGCAGTPPPAEPGPPASAAAGDTTIVAIQPAGSSHPTLLEFLGINELAVAKVGIDNHFNQLLTHLFPGLATSLGGLEPGPPLKSITDPANLAEDAPPVNQAAAEVKEAEDQAAQKVQAIKYLATVGCIRGYPQIEEAFLLALDDPTEVVRYETVNAIRQTAGHGCDICDGNSCCTPVLREKLIEIAYDKDVDNCWVEPSARVRRLARVAIESCGPPPPREVEPGEIPEEELEGPPGPGLPDEPLEGPGAPPPPPIGPPGDEFGSESLPESVPPPTQEPEVPPPVIQHDFGDGGIEQIGYEASVPSQGQSQPVAATASVRWERVRVPYPKFGSKRVARSVIEYLHDRAMGRSSGPPPEANFKAVQTETFHWTNPARLRSPQLRDQLIRLPVGQVSPVLEDEIGYYIVRVLERTGMITQQYANPTVVQRRPAPSEEIDDSTNGATSDSKGQLGIEPRALPASGPVDPTNDTDGIPPSRPIAN